MSEQVARNPVWLGSLCAVLENPGVLDRLLSGRATLTGLFPPMPEAADWSVGHSRINRPRCFPSGQLPTWEGVRSLLADRLAPADEEAVLWQMVEPDLAEQ